MFDVSAILKSTYIVSYCNSACTGRVETDEEAMMNIRDRGMLKFEDGIVMICLSGCLRSNSVL